MAKNNLTGRIGVTTENIFPVIKKFLYSDREIFLRELVANAVDASLKMKALAASSAFSGELGPMEVRIELDEKKKTLRIEDRGVGMTEEEVDKYINQIAFSSAGEFLEKYKDQISNIIGHFGLGFYSAFMVSAKVTIDTLSWQEGAKAVRWTCDGTPEYTMEAGDKTERGTVVTLYLEESAEEFAAKGRIEALLGKYCKFMPVPVIFGKEQEWKDGKYVDTDKDKVINAVEPLWTRQPSELEEKDYMEFYRTLYPMKEEPLFYIHLNVDYPFHLTGILYFPKIKERMAVEKNNIQLYCNRMFVTDHVENIVPDFLTLLHGVIDSPDIPLNVSRSYLQNDSNVRKISGYITRKVADRLEEIFKTQRPVLESKWNNLKLFIEYGMLSDDKFRERGMKFALWQNTEGKFFSYDEYLAAIKDHQTDKDKKTVCLYATDAEAQYAFIEAAKSKGYDVLLMDCELDAHFVNLLETHLKDVRFARVDSDSIDKLIPKEEPIRLQLSEEDARDLSELFKAVLPEGNDYTVEADNLGEGEAPVVITQNEFMRRYKEMSAFGGGLNFYGTMPDSYHLIVNMEHPLVAAVFQKEKETVPAQAALPEMPGEGATEEERNKVRDERKAIEEKHRQDIAAFATGNAILRQLADLALLANGMLKGKALNDFIGRSRKVMEDAYIPEGKA